jgi:ElaB/YqjD/DUF883 family membrane-anchored ribosome-binding protein
MIDRMPELGSSLGSRADEIKEKALDLAATARERFEQGSHRLREFTVRNPARAVGIALGVGILTGWLIKRR